MRNSTYLFCFLSTLFSFSLGAEQSFSSGLKKVPLIELYTSEGCSSCPPADLWLSRFKKDERLWSGFVPIAFHVDYWDYIGWKDPYAKRENAVRQRKYQKQGYIKSVYTPGVIFMGQEWPTWYYQQSIPNVDWSEVGELSVRINNGITFVQYTPQDQQKKLQNNLKAHVSILGFNLTSQIKRGENRGKTLEHDFVNLAHVQAKTSLAQTQPTGTNYQWEFTIPDKFLNSKDKQGIAVWISTTGSQQPIQATGDWLK